MTMADRIAILNDGKLQQIGPPEVVFNRPANTFVARFIGSPNINLFDASLEETADGYRVIGESFEFTLTSEDLASDIPAQDVEVGARAQDLMLITDEADADFTMSGEIELIEPLGTDAIVRIQTLGGPVTAMLDGYERLDRGEEISLGIDVEDLYLFDADGELLKPRHYEEEVSDELTA